MQNDLIALVDENDKVIDYANKQLVHEQGLLHRAFSILVFNSKNEVLLHQRALSKYHSPGLWTNTCCSHLLKDTEMETCIHDRLQLEMGFDCELDFNFSFTYKINFDNGLTEHETDHVYTGFWEGTPNPNITEVAGYKWMNINDLKSDMKLNSDRYTYWFKYLMYHYFDQIKISKQI